MRPRTPRSSIVRATAREQRNVPFRLIPSTRSQASSDSSTTTARSGPAGAPALFTRTSMRPNV